MPRATFDVNVLISGLISKHGVAARLLALARDGAFALQLSDAILEEMVEVLERDFDWSKERTTQARAFLSALAQHVMPHVELDVVKRDPDDNSILECSLASRSDYLVTSDKDLLSLQRYGGADILKPAEYLARLLENMS